MSLSTDAYDVMSNNDFENVPQIENERVAGLSELENIPISCIDCSQMFDWTGGEQLFYIEKGLENPPKRCKACKIAKNQRLEAIEHCKLTGKRHVIEVRADCAQCGRSTTVPFYPSQGRPVYCRACFIDMRSQTVDEAGA